jgi:hypothetical protein
VWQEVRVLAGAGKLIHRSTIGRNRPLADSKRTTNEKPRPLGMDGVSLGCAAVKRHSASITAILDCLGTVNEMVSYQDVPFSPTA